MRGEPEEMDDYEDYEDYEEAMRKKPLPVPSKITIKLVVYASNGRIIGLRVVTNEEEIARILGNDRHLLDN